jgi:hypothetical protein
LSNTFSNSPRRSICSKENIPDRIIDEKPRNGVSVTRELAEGIIDIKVAEIGDDIKEEDEEVLENAMGDIIMECGFPTCKLGAGGTVWKTASLPAIAAVASLNAHTDGAGQVREEGQGQVQQEGVWGGAQEVGGVDGPGKKPDRKFKQAGRSKKKKLDVPVDQPLIWTFLPVENADAVSIHEKGRAIHLVGNYGQCGTK